MTDRYQATELVAFAERLFAAAGQPADRARLIAELLVEADLMGHTTHGLQLAPPYLDHLREGKMAKTGKPTVLADRGAAVTWDGRWLSGVWLTATALDLAVARARQYGTASVAIRRSHHIACLAAYLPRTTDQGMMVTIASSDPSVAAVAPYGGRKPLFTPNPIAWGIPTDSDPILIDISASITTMGLAARLRQAGGRMAYPWLLDAEGRATDDPAALVTDPPGSILPVGGLDHGHKGFGLALAIEAMTQGLAGFGRADQPTEWGATVLVQVHDPDCFGGGEAFRRQMGWLARACRESPPAQGFERVRLPGDGALARKRAALSGGVELHPGILDGLRPWGDKLGVAPPSPL